MPVSGLTEGKCRNVKKATEEYDKQKILCIEVVIRKVQFPKFFVILTNSFRLPHVFSGIQWLKSAVDDANNYTRFNTELPENLPLRDGSFSDYYYDTPITQSGLKMAIETGCF